MYKSTYMTHGMLFSHSFNPTVTLAKDEVRLPVPHFEAYFVTYRISALLSSLLSEKVLKSWFACRGNCIEIQLPRVVYTKLQSGYWSRMDDKRLQRSQWLKITEKVSFIIASEASYVYILSGQKFIKNAKNGQFWRFFGNLKMRLSWWFSTTVSDVDFPIIIIA